MPQDPILAALEKEKLLAVQNEDYELASKLKK
jgi:hypothetical protein